MYKFKKGTKIGGKYGMQLALNYSAISGLKTTPLYDGMGYESDFFGIGDVPYFSDFNIEITKKFSKKVKATFSYMNLVYNKDVIQGLAGYGTIYADIGGVDLTYKIKRKRTLRMEFQGLSTKQDDGSWVQALAEYTMAPHWFLAAFNEHNFGNKKEHKRLHYFTAQGGYKNKGNTITVGYGRQRAGIYCVGGVCRNVPASNGITLAITSSFQTMRTMQTTKTFLNTSMWLIAFSMLFVITSCDKIEKGEFLEDTGGKCGEDRKSVVQGKIVDVGGRRIIKKNK